MSDDSISLPSLPSDCDLVDLEESFESNTSKHNTDDFASSTCDSESSASGSEEGGSKISGNGSYDESSSVEEGAKKKKRRSKGKARHFLKRRPKQRRKQEAEPGQKDEEQGEEPRQEAQEWVEPGQGNESEGFSDILADVLSADPSGISESEKTMTESSMPPSENDPDSERDNPESATKLDEMDTVPVSPPCQPKKRRKKIGDKRKYDHVRTPLRSPEVATSDAVVGVRPHALLKHALQDSDVSEKNLLTVSELLKSTIDESWTVATSGDVLFVSRITTPTNPIIERSIIFHKNELKFFVHNRQLPSQHSFWETSKITSLKCLDVVDHLVAVSQDFLNLEMCSGVVSHQDIWQKFSSEGHIDSLHSTPCLRSSGCTFLQLYPGKCSSCRRLHRKLWEHERQKARSAGKGNVNQNKVNDRYLQREEILSKMKRIEQEKKLSRQLVRRLKRRLDQMIKKNSERISNELGEDFSKIMNENLDKMTAVEKIFWEQQSKALSKRGKSKTMRWHPCMIRLALNIRSISPAAFDYLSGVISLPSARRLYDYSHFTDIKEGIQVGALDEFRKKFEEQCTKDDEKYFSLMLDEMSIRSELVYSSRTGELVGFTNLTSLERELTCLEAEIQGKVFEKQLAKKVLVFMLSGCTNPLVCVAAVFSTDNLSAAQLYVRAWDVIYSVEEIGVKVLVVICDGASVNRKYIRMHFNMGDKDFTYVTSNSASGEKRSIFFMLDPPHLIKTFRNCFANSSSHRNSRSLWNNGQNISWKAIEALFQICQQEKFKATKLTKAHVYLTSFSCMKVFLAVQVFSRSVVEALVKYKDISPLKEEYNEELVKFIHMMNRLFDCLNCSIDSLKKKSNPDLLEYTSASDTRLKFLEEEFIQYLEDWENSVSNREGRFTKDQKSKMIISFQSLEGLKITINSFSKIVKLLLEKGASSVSGRKLSQDKLEQHFSDLRRKGGDDNNPTVKQVLHTEVSIAAQGGMTSASKHGNTEVRKREMVVDSSKLPVKKKQKN